MAVIATLLTSGSTSASSSVTTASISPDPSNLVIVTVYNTLAGGATLPTVSGASMTWVQVDTIQLAALYRYTIFRGMSSSPGSGALTIDFGGTTQTAIHWTVTEFANVATGGTNGSDAVVQDVMLSAASIKSGDTITLAAFGATINATFGGLAISQNTAITPGAGFTELDERSTLAGNSEIEFKDTNDTTVDWTYASGLTNSVGGAIEIKGAFTVNESENITVTESKSLSVAANVNVSENITVGESDNETQVFNSKISDSITITENDNETQVDNTSVSDSITVTENDAETKVFNTSVSDSITITENELETQVFNVSVTENITISENLKNLVTSFINKSDTVTVSEFINATQVFNLDKEDANQNSNWVQGVRVTSPQG